MTLEAVVVPLAAAIMVEGGGVLLVVRLDCGGRYSIVACGRLCADEKSEKNEKAECWRAE